MAAQCPDLNFCTAVSRSGREASGTGASDDPPCCRPSYAHGVAHRYCGVALRQVRHALGSRREEAEDV